MALSGSWQKCPPSSTSCCLRAASTYGLRQPSGSRRCSRGGHFSHDPSTSHVILYQNFTRRFRRSRRFRCLEGGTLLALALAAAEFHFLEHLLPPLLVGPSPLGRRLLGLSGPTSLKLSVDRRTQRSTIPSTLMK